MIRSVGSDGAFGGECAAVLGGSRGTVDTLSQFVGGLPAYYDGSILSFHCKALARPHGGSKGDSLRVQLVDAETGNSVPIAVVTPETETWEFFRYPLSSGGLGLLPGRDYYLEFEATTGPHAWPTTYLLDEVQLEPPQRAMLLPTDPPDPPDTIPDEDGDMPYQSSPGIGFVDITPHHDVPNTCSCGYPAHQTVTITTTGFTQAEFSSAVVKFKTPSSSVSKVASVLSRSYDPATATGVLSCTVPDSPGGKNYLGSASVKVKASNGKKAASPQYHFDTAGLERGFWYGFPSPVSGIQLLSSATPSVLGGETFSVRATGMATFTKYRPNASPPRCGDRPDQDFVHPLVFVKDSANTKVKVLRSTLNPAPGTPCASAPVNWTWTGTWSDDGAPGVCTSATPCIPTRTPLSAVFLNPDNVTEDGTLSPRIAQYKTQIDNFLQFLEPDDEPKLPSLSGVSPNWADSVGGVFGCGGPVTSNQIVLSGANLKRIASVRNAGETVLWSGLSGGPDGTSLFATAPAHPVGAVRIQATTADGLTAESDPGALSYVCSFQAPCGVFQGPFTYTSAPPPGTYHRTEWLTAKTGQNEDVSFSASLNAGDEAKLKAIPYQEHLDTTLPGGAVVTEHRLGFYVYVEPLAASGTQSKYDVIVQQACTGATIFAGQITFLYKY
ncbi:MAG: hypothetical protein ACOYXN_10475 [Acidobacteriota bacterium]